MKWRLSPSTHYFKGTSCHFNLINSIPPSHTVTQCDQMLDYKVAILPQKGCLKCSHRSFPFKSDVFKLAKKSPDIWATLTRKWIAKNYEKSPNLVTLHTNYRRRNLLLKILFIFTAYLWPIYDRKV